MLSRFKSLPPWNSWKPSIIMGISYSIHVPTNTLKMLVLLLDLSTKLLQVFNQHLRFFQCRKVAALKYLEISKPIFSNLIFYKRNLQKSSRCIVEGLLMSPTSPLASINVTLVYYVSR